MEEQDIKLIWLNNFGYIEKDSAYYHGNEVVKYYTGPAIEISQQLSHNLFLSGRKHIIISICKDKLIFLRKENKHYMLKTYNSEQDILKIKRALNEINMG